MTKLCFHKCWVLWKSQSWKNDICAVLHRPSRGQESHVAEWALVRWDTNAPEFFHSFCQTTENPSAHNFEHTITVLKHDGSSIIVWGSFSSDMMDKLVRVDRKLKTRRHWEETSLATADFRLGWRPAFLQNRQSKTYRKTCHGVPEMKASYCVWINLDRPKSSW